ncbi:MAG TPA: hypothetical protein VGC72_16525 [Candidatus Elarobacter sp.]|jgi:hypothetical protein
MQRFAGAGPTGLGQKAFWIVVTTVLVMLACASVVLSQGRGAYPFWDYNVDGMPRPDGEFVQRDPGRRPDAYAAKSRADGSILITHNGAQWVTLSVQKNQFILSDPNGTGHAVVKMNAGGAGHGTRETR